MLCARCVRCDVSSDHIALFYVLRYAVRVMTQQNATFWGCAPRRGYDPQIQTRPRSLCNAPTPKFYHPMFTRSEVIVLTNKPTNPPTNKQTPQKTPNVLRYATTWVKHHKRTLQQTADYMQLLTQETTNTAQNCKNDEHSKLLGQSFRLRFCFNISLKSRQVAQL